MHFHMLQCLAIQWGSERLSSWSSQKHQHFQNFCFFWLVLATLRPKVLFRMKLAFLSRKTHIFIQCPFGSSRTFSISENKYDCAVNSTVLKEMRQHCELSLAAENFSRSWGMLQSLKKPRLFCLPDADLSLSSSEPYLCLQISVVPSELVKQRLLSFSLTFPADMSSQCHHYVPLFLFFLF